MKRLIGLVCMLSLLVSAPAVGFNQVDVDKLKAGETELAGADFSNLQLPRPKAPETKYTDKNLEGATFQNGNLNGRVFCTSNLKNTNFNGASLQNFHNSQCDFTGANFVGADFPAVIINGSKMRNCNFSNITTQNAAMNAPSQFQTTDMSGSNFSGANLTKAIFFKCDLTGVDWSGATLSKGTTIRMCIVDVRSQHILASADVTLIDNQWVGGTGGKATAISKPNIKVNKSIVPKQVTVPKK